MDLAFFAFCTLFAELTQRRRQLSQLELHSTLLLSSTLLYFTLPYYPTLPYSTLLYSTLLLRKQRGTPELVEFVSFDPCPTTLGSATEARKEADRQQLLRQ